MAARSKNKKQSTSKNIPKGFNSKKQQQQVDNATKVAPESTFKANFMEANEAKTLLPQTETITTTASSKILEREDEPVNNHHDVEPASTIIYNKDDRDTNLNKQTTTITTPESISNEQSTPLIVTPPTTINATSDPTTDLYSEAITMEPSQQEQEDELLPKVVPPQYSSSPTSTKIEMNPFIMKTTTSTPKRNEPESLQVSHNDESNNSFQSLPDSVELLTTENGTEVYLIGTAHFSSKSVQDVRQIIRDIQPNAVVLELCEERAFMLLLDEESLLEQNRKLSFDKIRSAIREKGLAQGLIYIMFVKMSANLTEKLGMAPGSEFRAGSSEALKIPGCSIILGDRSLKVTVARAVASLSLWQKIKLIYQVLLSDVSITQEDVEKCKDKDILEQLLKELGGEFPGFKRVLLDERNIYLAHSIYTWSQRNNSSTLNANRSCLLPPRPARVVAIVGCGHVQGILDNWGRTSEEEVKKLNEIPKSSRTRRVVTKTIKYCSLALLLYVSYRTIVPSSIQSAILEKIVG